MAYTPLSIIGFSLTSLNLNNTGDVATFTGLPSRYLVSSLVLDNWSTTPSALLTATLRDAATAGGNSLVGSIAGLNAIVTATALAAQAFPLASTLGANRSLTASSLYLNVSAANGSALTATGTLFVLKLT